jgi:cytochrome c oxidase assembly protein subunit 15
MSGPWDLFYEHLHRLLGAAVGMISIALCLAIWLRDDRRWMKVLGAVALLAVCVQGALGGMRVISDDRQLAMVHGCFGPAFFALTVALAVFSSRRWRQAEIAVTHTGALRLQSLSALTCLLAYVQLVLGAQIRHMPVDASAGAFRGAVLFHLLMAAVLAAHVLALAVRVWREHRQERALRTPAIALAALLTVQIVLGCATWVVNYSWPSWLGDTQWTADYVVLQEGLPQVLVTTAHVAVGSLILAVAVVATLRSLRLLGAEPRHVDVTGRLTEVAV